MSDKCGRQWANAFIEKHCRDIPQRLVYELGTGPSELFWRGSVERFDYSVEGWDMDGFYSPGKTEHLGAFEDIKPKDWAPCDVFSSVWSISYSYDPVRVLNNAIAITQTGGHLLIVTRTANHNKESWTGDVMMKWLPTPDFMVALEDTFPSLGLVELDLSDDGEFFAGLWRKQ